MCRIRMKNIYLIEIKLYSIEIETIFISEFIDV